VLAWKLRHWIFAAATLVPPTLLHAALPTESDTSGPTSFAGQLLVASPQLRQPAFDHAVILIAKHDSQGALGIVINHPLGTRAVASLLSAFGADASGVIKSVPIFLGGPVDPAVGFVLHSAEYRSPETIDIDGRVALTSSPGVVRDIGLGKGPDKSLIVFGYAGWSASQLEDELAHGVWIMVAEDLGLVFDDDRSRVWADALTRHKTIR
jgi:putative transcriptional regulator